MLKILLPISFFLMIGHGVSSAQVFTAYGLHFERVPIMERAGIYYSSTATIDVVRGVPVIKYVVTTPKYDLADTETRRFIRTLIFIRDTSDYKLTFILKENPHLMNAYAEVFGDSIIMMYPPGCHNRTIDFFGRRYLEYGKDTLISSITIMQYMQTNAYIHDSVDVYLERVFDNGKDSTIIIQNNYPEAEKEILESSNIYSKEQFESDIPPGALQQGVRYFIRPHLYHVYPCGIVVQK